MMELITVDADPAERCHDSGVLNDTLTELLGEKIEIMGASRTDAGVHALGNVAVFDTNTRIPGEKISYALNQRLPDDIRIHCLRK